MGQWFAAPVDDRVDVVRARRKLSLIVPAFNEAVLLGATLDSLHASAGAQGLAYEIIVVDDASTDTTVDIARGRGARVVSVNYRQIAATRNAGARAATGQILVFVDADTLVPAATLAAAMAALQAGAVGGGAGLRFDGELPMFARLLMPVSLLVLRVFRRAPGCFIFCTRAAFASAGGFDEAFFGAEDLVLSAALKQHGRFVILREVVTTSGRKLRTHSFGSMLWLLLRLTFGGTRVIKQRTGMELWYGERRDERSPPPRSKQRTWY